MQYSSFRKASVVDLPAPCWIVGIMAEYQHACLYVCSFVPRLSTSILYCCFSSHFRDGSCVDTFGFFAEVYASAHVASVDYLPINTKSVILCVVRKIPSQCTMERDYIVSSSVQQWDSAGSRCHRRRERHIFGMKLKEVVCVFEMKSCRFLSVFPDTDLCWCSFEWAVATC